MVKVKVIYDKDSCIGAAACESLNPANWKIQDDGTADLVGGSEVEAGLWEAELELTPELEEAAKSCPVKAIVIKK